jgi:capsular exopolysaccharide synthesis family protein
MVTSPGQGEGKSTTAANLAVVLSQEGKKVLLIDADLRKPTVHYSFKVSNINGLTSVLTKQIMINEAIQPTNVTNLNVLTSGSVPPNPSELLNSNIMENVLEAAKEAYDYVILDTPPVLPVTDATILANKCDGVVFVIANGTTGKEKAVKAKDQLLHANAKLLGAVFNGSDQNDSYTYYYGGNH